MNNYDFETVIRRVGRGSQKWNEVTKTIGEIPPDVIPFSVADMELKTPPEITEGLKYYLDTNSLGYAQPGPEYLEAVRGWMEKRHSWNIETQWIQDIHGVIHGFFAAVKAFTEEGQGVMLMTPVYYPMYYAVQRNNRVLVENKLVRTGDTYEIDFVDFEEKAKDKNTRLLILCSPHNPTGRVWTLEELQRIGRICEENGVIVVSDEIHFDLVSRGVTHRVFASVSPSFAQNSLILTSPSKTFNLAGLQCANAIIPNPLLRQRFYEELQKEDGNPKCNLLGLEACRLAYERCESWLEQLLDLVERNRNVVTEFMEREFPQVQVMKMEGTYLLWMDFSGLGIPGPGLARKLKEEARLFFDDGYIFGTDGEGFERWNLACPTRYVEAGLTRLREAFKG